MFNKEIIKNSIKAFVIQISVPLFYFIVINILQSDSYDSSISIPNYEYYGHTEKSCRYEYIISCILMLLYFMCGMLLKSQKSRIKNFISILLSIIIISIFPMKNMYTWLPYIFINNPSRENYTRIESVKPYSFQFFILILIPIIFIWLGLEFKILLRKKKKV